MNKLRFLWGRLSKGGKDVVSLLSLTLGAGTVAGLITGSLGWFFVVAISIQAAIVIAIPVAWIRTQLTDHEDEPQKPGVEPDPWGES